MKIDATIQSFSDLSEKQQAIVLARLAFELTILARDTYPVEGKAGPSSTMGRDINELQHRLAAAVVDRLTGNRNRYPDEVLVRMCADPSDNPLAQSSGPALARLIAEVGTARDTG